MARDRSTVKRCLVALALLEMLEEEGNFTGTKRGKTRHWIKRKGDMIVLAIDLRVAPSSWFHSFRFSTARRDCLYFLRRVIETFSHSPYRILTSTRNARSKYKQRTITMETCARSTMLDERHATWWPNEYNMLDSTMLHQHVGSVWSGLYYTGDSICFRHRAEYIRRSCKGGGLGTLFLLGYWERHSPGSKRISCQNKHGEIIVGSYLKTSEKKNL